MCDRDRRQFSGPAFFVKLISANRKIISFTDKWCFLSMHGLQSLTLNRGSFQPDTGILRAGQPDFKAAFISTCRLNGHIPGINDFHVEPCVIVNPDLAECRALETEIKEEVLPEESRILGNRDHIVPLDPIIVPRIPQLQPQTGNILQEASQKTEPCGTVSSELPAVCPPDHMIFTQVGFPCPQ